MSMQKKRPFDDLLNVINQLSGQSITRVNTETLHKETKSLEGVKLWLSGWQDNEIPSVAETHICVFASTYETNDVEEVKAFIEKASKGNSPVNRLCVDHGIGLRILELAPEMPHDLQKGWSEAECVAAIAFGMEATAAGGNLLGVSSLAPGTTHAAKEIIKRVSPDCSVILSSPDEQETCNKDSPLKAPDEVLGVLQKYGGREIAACVGALIAARSRRLPVIIDGWSGLAAIAVLEAVQRGLADHVLVASANNECFSEVANALGKKTLINPFVSTGPGCGIAMGVSLLKASCDL